LPHFLICEISGTNTPEIEYILNNSIKDILTQLDNWCEPFFDPNTKTEEVLFQMKINKPNPSPNPNAIVNELDPNNIEKVAQLTKIQFLKKVLQLF
jgi:hypothetical protein